MKVRENTQRDMGYRIAQRRTEMGLSQEKLAESIGVNRNTVMRIENGEHAPRADTGILISVCFQARKRRIYRTFHMKHGIIDARERAKRHEKPCIWRARCTSES